MLLTLNCRRSMQQVSLITSTCFVTSPQNNLYTRYNATKCYLGWLHKNTNVTCHFGLKESAFALSSPDTISCNMWPLYQKTLQKPAFESNAQQLSSQTTSQNVLKLNLQMIPLISVLYTSPSTETVEPQPKPCMLVS